MRMLLTAVLETEAANEAIRNGSMAQVLEDTMKQLNPEAAYFYPADGRRAMLLVFDLADPSQVPPMIEPFWLNANAQVTLTPCMNAEELQSGLSQVQPSATGAAG